MCVRLSDQSYAENVGSSLSAAWIHWIPLPRSEARRHLLPQLLRERWFELPHRAGNHHMGCLYRADTIFGQPKGQLAVVVRCELPSSSRCPGVRPAASGRTSRAYATPEFATHRERRAGVYVVIRGTW